MKKTSKILALVLCLVLCMSVMALSAFAAEAEQDGLKLTLTTDKAEYAAGEQIIANLKVENLSDAAISNVSVEIQAPEGISVVSDAAQEHFVSLAAGAAGDLEVIFKGQDVSSTGDGTLLILAGAAAVACAAIVLMVYNRKAACMVLAVVLVVGLALPAAAATESKSLEVSTTVKLGNKTVTLKATASWKVEKLPVINTTVNADLFDMSGVENEVPVIKSLNGAASNTFAAFNGTPSQYYVATAYVKITDPSAGDTWSRVGISHWNGTNSYYGFQVSPGPDFNARKVVTMVITDGNVQWGTVTDRSQNWWQNNQAALDYSNLKLTTVRNGNTYYAFVNDRLWYVEEGMADFDNVDTLPVLNVGSCAAEFSNMSVQYGQNNVTAFLQAAEKAMFYAADTDKTILGADGSIQFTGAADQSCALNAKDHAAKSLGCAAMLPANTEGVVEFDLKIGYFGGRDGLPALAVTINRYDDAFAEARSLVIGQYKAGWTGWNSNGNLNEGIGSGGEGYKLDDEEFRLEEGQTYHVKFIRLMTANGQDTRMIISDADGNVLLDHTHGWQDGYKGRAYVSFLCRDVDCTISNLTIG